VQDWSENIVFLFSIREIKIFEKTVANKALRGNSPQTPTQRLDCGELRQCHRSQQYFIYT
jgi:hypothetical protein